jgi:hypothetical protein
MRKWRASLSNAGMSLGYQFSEKRQWHKKAHEKKERNIGEWDWIITWNNRWLVRWPNNIMCDYCMFQVRSSTYMNIEYILSCKQKKYFCILLIKISRYYNILNVFRNSRLQFFRINICFSGRQYTISIFHHVYYLKSNILLNMIGHILVI